MKIRALIFDVGKVLLFDREKNDYERFEEFLHLKKNSFREFYKIYRPKLQRGKMGSEEFFALTKKKFNFKESVPEIIATWNRAHFDNLETNEELLNLIKKLKKKYIVGIISNVASFHLDENMPIYKEFDPCIFSSKVGMAKPDREIFDLMLEKIKLKAEECIFIDDHAEMAEGAGKLGFNTILFENNHKLIQQLKRFGV